MIAIIPAAGLGTRFLPLTRVVPKEMLPIGNRPAIDLIAEEARAAGATRIIIVISERKALIRDYFAEAKDVEFVYQQEQRGLGHAVLQAAAACGATSGNAEQVLILLGDALVSGCCAAAEMAKVSNAHGGASVIGCETVPMERVSRYGVLKLKDGETSSASDCGQILDLVEKPSPSEAPGNLVIAGRYLLDSAIFDFLATQTPGKANEIQLTDAIRRMLPSHPVFAYRYPGKRHDIGNPDGYYETLRAFLTRRRR